MADVSDVYIDCSDQKALIRENSSHFSNSNNNKSITTEGCLPTKVSSSVSSNNIKPISTINEEEKHNDVDGNDDNDDDTLHLDVKPVHITSNIWPLKRTGKEMKRKASRSYIHGVEIRILSGSHVLSGQAGLFAVNPFEQFDIVGEYCGKVTSSSFYTPPVGGGEYVANLEDTRHFVYPLGLDAQSFGNECRAINHYRNIADKPNCIMKRCYVEELPRVIIICTRNIEVGEEFLLDYGKAYVDSFLS